MTEIQITLSVLGAVIVALAFLRTNPDVILLSGLSILMVLGVVNPAQAFGGFSNEGLATVGVLFVVAEGLRQTGGIGFLGQSLLGQPNHLRSAQSRMMIPVAVMSAFMNNTPVVAITIPIVRDWARKLRISVSYLLLPLSYAAILGGLCTLVGTSTTLVVNGLLIEHQIAVGEKGVGISMFEIAWVGIPAALCGLLYLIFFTRWILPQRVPAISKFENPREYSVEMLVSPGSALVGKTIESAGLRQLPGMYLLEIDREGHILAAVSSNERLRAKDRLVFVGIVESVVDLQKIPGLKPATDQLFKLDSPRADRCLVEAVVSNSFPFLGMSIRESRFRSHFNAAVIAVARNGERLNQKIGDIELLPGDTLLLETHPNFVGTQRNSRDFFLVSRVSGSTPPRHERAWIARMILLAMVVSVSTGWLSMIKASLLAAAAMVVTKCCKGSEARRAIDWSVLLTIGAGLGIGKAVQVSGTASLLSDRLIDSIGSNPYVILVAIYVITMVLTNIITAKAAAVLVFPIAIAAAQHLGPGTNIMPFVIAVMVAAAASFASPVGYQTNLMVYGPGGYRTSDYIRLGGPLSLIIGAITVIIAPIIWKF